MSLLRLSAKNNLENQLTWIKGRHSYERGVEWLPQLYSSRRTLDHPERYDFADVSQNNHNSGQKHWENAVWVRRYVAERPRPINTVKTYGADGNRFGHTDRDGLERFWRHILAGFAAVRFHRPDSGLGLNEKARSAIQAARKLESLIKMWELSPREDLLSEREENEAYLAGSSGKAYALYFTDGGSIRLETPPGHYAVHWISLHENGPSGHLTPESDGRMPLAAPGSGHWLAVVLKK